MAIAPLPVPMSAAVRQEREGESRSTKGFAAVYYWLMRRIALPEMPAKGADFLLVDRKVIDAYNGTMTFYTFDERDPLLAAYALDRCAPRSAKRIADHVVERVKKLESAQ